MECTRCHGLMVEQACWEREAWQVSYRWARPYRMWSCMNCGNCFDRTIAFNRTQPAAVMQAERHARVWHKIRKLCNEVAV